MRFSPTKLFHGLLYLAPVLFLTLVACGGGGGGSTPNAPLAAAFTLSVNVTGVSGVGVVLRNNGGNDLAATTPGVYSFGSVIAGASYDVTVLSHPSAPVQVCTVTSPSGTMPGSNLTLGVNCVNAFTISVTVTGDTSIPTSIGPVLQNNGGDNLFIPKITPTTSASYAFSIPVESGVPYTITQYRRPVSKSQDCTLSNVVASGIVSGDVSLAITCVSWPVPDPRFAYVTNSASNTVSAYTIDPASGVLANETTVTPGIEPYSVSVEPSGRFAYVMNRRSGTPYSGSISAYSIDAFTGELTNPQAGIATGDLPISITVHPSGEFAYVVNQGNGSTTGNSISAYSINTTTGALSAIDANGASTSYQASIATESQPYTITIDPLGRFAYVANDFSNNVSAYTINQMTGALTPVAGSPFAAGTNPRSVVIDPSGQFAYVANAGGDISAYRIDTVTVNGALNQINCVTPGISTCSGNNYTAGSTPRSIAVDTNSGQYAYVANAGGGVSAFGINTTTGELSAIDADDVIPGSDLTIAAGANPFSINVDPSGQFVYVANFTDNNVSVYTINQVNGALTEVAGSPFAAGTGPTSVTTTQ